MRTSASSPALTLEAGTGYGDTPEAALDDAITVAALSAELGHGPAARVLDQGGATWTPDAIKALRRSLSLTQEAFAELLHVTPNSVRHWKQGIRRLSRSSARLLDYVAATPGPANRWLITREGTRPASHRQRGTLA
jgi:DNA-binding transcriptional regulator YiaG